MPVGTGGASCKYLLDFLRHGDTLVVTRIDRLARSVKDLQDIVHELKAKGVALKATEQPVDTATAAGKAFLDMLGVFAEFETNLRRERQLEGIAAAKTRGVYKGCKSTIDTAEVRRLKEEEKLGPAVIARRLGMVGPRSIGCWARPGARWRGWAEQCRSAGSCVPSIRRIGRSSAAGCGSGAPAACASAAAVRTAA